MISKDKINKAFDERFKNILDDTSQIEEIKSFLSSIRQSDIDSLIEWAKKQSTKVDTRRRRKNSSYLQ